MQSNSQFCSENAKIIQTLIPQDRDLVNSSFEYLQGKGRMKGVLSGCIVE